MTENLVGIYYDFDNIHLGALEALKGEDEVNRLHRSNLSHPAVVDFNAIEDYASSFGRVVINKAYGNWLRFPKYQNSVKEHALELYQIFPVGGKNGAGKNGADIKMSLDVLLDLRTVNLTHLIIVTGDSDFVPLVQSVLKTGVRVMAVGTKNRASRYLVNVCDEFVYYEDLVNIVDPKEADYELAEVRKTGAELLKQAVRQLTTHQGKEWLVAEDVWGVIRRLDPAFSMQSARYGILQDYFEDNLKIVKTKKVDGALFVADARSSSSEPTEPVASPGYNYRLSLARSRDFRFDEDVFSQKTYDKALNIFMGKGPAATWEYKEELMPAFEKELGIPSSAVKKIAALYRSSGLFDRERKVFVVPPTRDCAFIELHGSASWALAKVTGDTVDPVQLAWTVFCREPSKDELELMVQAVAKGKKIEDEFYAAQEATAQGEEEGL